MLRTFFLIAAGCFAAAAVAEGASVDFALTSSLLQAQPGQTVTFFGSLANTGLSDAYINGDTFTSTLPVDDLPFILLVPPVLSAGQTYNGALFDVQVPTGTAPGLYTGSFDVLGGDSAADFNVLAVSTFGVQVTPEPSGLGLLFIGLGGVAFVRWKHVRTAAGAKL